MDDLIYEPMTKCFYCGWVSYKNDMVKLDTGIYACEDCIKNNKEAREKVKEEYEKYKQLSEQMFYAWKKSAEIRANFLKKILNM